MDALPPTSDMLAPPGGFVAVPDPRRAEFLLDAVKTALYAPGEHRLFRAGKLTGLFPSRGGSSAEAALQAIRDGLLETVRTETKGKLVTEWVRATSKAIGFVHEHDSPRAVLRELKQVLDATRGGVPAFLCDAKAELAALAARFEARATAMLARLDDLAKRCEAALRRAEAAVPTVADPVAGVVPWAALALEYLDQKAELGARDGCPLPELFHALRANVPDLSLPAFQDGLRRLHDARAVRLRPAATMPEVEHAIVVGGELTYLVSR